MPFNLSCTVGFHSIPNWTPKVTISDGTKNLEVTRILNEDRISAEVEIPTPIDGQSYKCSTSFDSPPPNATLEDDPNTFMLNRSAPLFKQEQDLVPYRKSSKFTSYKNIKY